MPSSRRRLPRMLALASVIACSGAFAEGLGLRVAAGEELWPRWQARMLTATSFSLWRHAARERFEPVASEPESISLLGDYYFMSPALGRPGISGFRATTGMIFGPLGSGSLATLGDIARPLGRGAPRSGYAAAAEPRHLTGALDSAPYLGVGYTSASPKSGWGFSADIGVAARSGTSAARFGRVFLGSQSLDDLLREMRLTPLLNVGVSYSF